MTTQERSVDDFSRVRALGSIDVVITQGSKTRVEVEAPKNELERIETVVDDGTLSIRKKTSLGVRWGGGRTVVRVTVPTLASVSSSGSGDVQIDGLDGERLELETLGSGDAEVTGRIESLVLESTGSGDVEAAELRVQQATISMTGSGDVDLHVSETVDGSATGSGDLRVRGGASCNVSRTGSGDVDC